MLLLADQMVPDGLVGTFQDLGHEVLLVRKVLRPRAADRDVAHVAHLREAIVVTWNIKPFVRLLCRAPRGENIRFRKAGLLGFCGPEARASRRLTQVNDLLVYEFEHRRTMSDKRFFATVDENSVRIDR